jgi:hypothetical protein
MGDVMLALARTFANLREKRQGLALCADPGATFLMLTIGLAVWGLGWMVQQMMDYPPMTLLVGWGLVWLAYILAYLGGWMAIFAIAYLAASLLAAIVIMPLMLKHLSTPSTGCGGDGQGQLRGGGQQRCGDRVVHCRLGGQHPAVADSRLLPAYSAAADGLAEPPDLRLRRAVDACLGGRMAGHPPARKRRSSCSA